MQLPLALLPVTDDCSCRVRSVRQTKACGAATGTVVLQGWSTTVVDVAGVPASRHSVSDEPEAGKIRRTPLGTLVLSILNPYVVTSVRPCEAPFPPPPVPTDVTCAQLGVATPLAPS